AQLLMHYEQCRHLPVLAGARLIGMVSDRDILAALRSSLERLSRAERRKDESGIEIAEIMTPAPATTTAAVEAAAAGETLLARRIGALPVIDGETLAGILTESDFLAYVARTSVAEQAGADATHA